MLRDAHPAILGMVEHASSIHILGAGVNDSKPAHRAVHDLDGRGWRLVPIHPRDAGGSILGRPIRPSLTADAHPEVVVFFLAPLRARDAVRELLHAHPIEEMPLLWFQPGSEDEETLEMLNEAGILHIVDDCIVRFILRHHLTAASPQTVEPWCLQVASSDGDGCSLWTVETSSASQTPPQTALEWCGDFLDLARSQHTVPRYIRSLQQDHESLEDLAYRLAA